MTLQIGFASTSARTHPGTIRRDRRAPSAHVTDRRGGFGDRRQAQNSGSRAMKWHLEDFLSDGAEVTGRGIAATQAARGFSAGNGYLTGLIVDRSR